ncbi:MAG: hypothetical protein H0T42_28885 [Deltaproteobacteria bacterium]|nr:hypothetical protein [Deltaproteobacteria bacterium]
MRLIVCCLLAFAACGDSSDSGTASPDAMQSLDAGSFADAPAARTGLTVVWTAQPMLPGPFATNVNVSSVKLELARLEVIGDAGSTTATTTTNVEARWSVNGEPFPFNFSFAPPGIYSQVSLRIDGNVVAPSYEILGTVLINGATEQFKISDTDVLLVDIPGYNVILAAGLQADIPIQVELQNALDQVNFAALPVDMGKRTMNQTTTGIAAVRTALRTMTFVPGN